MKIRMGFDTWKFVQAVNKEKGIYSGAAIGAFWSLIQDVAKRGLELNDEKLNELLFLLGLIDEVKNEPEKI